LSSLITEALRVAQEYDLAVFPVASDKRPRIKGWRTEATRDPDRIRELFSLPGAAGIGVPCGPDNDIICFDLDFGHSPTDEERSRLQAWLAEHQEAIERGARIHQTRSGGLHVVMLYPERHQPPRLMAPKFEVVRDGFYFIWPTEGSGYSVLQEPEELQEPSVSMMTPLGGFEYGEGGSLMSADEADRTMRTDGAGGARHDALLRMTQDWAAWHPELVTLPKLCASFVDWFTDIYGDVVSADRTEALLEWRVDERTGEVSGELGRAFNGVRRSYDAGLPDSVLDRVAAKVQERKSSGVMDIRDMFVTADQLRQEEELRGDIFVRFERSKEVSLAPWVIEDVAREGDFGGVVGVANLGKTNISAAFVAGLASGQAEKCGMPPVGRPRVVAWANAEEPAEALWLRLDAFCDATGVELVHPPLIAGYEELRGKADFLMGEPRKTKVNPKVVQKWVDELVSYGVEVLFIDPITEFNDGEENDRGDRKRLMAALREICERAGIMLMYWAHTGKPPEGKRDDWYEGDIYAERGSSAGAGATNFGGTAVRMYPDGYRAGAALSFRERASDPDDPTPNLIRITFPRVKLLNRKRALYYRIVRSAEMYSGQHIPVALPVSEAEARALLQQAASLDDRHVLIPQARALIEHIGEGRHANLSQIHEVMREVEGSHWPKTKTIRADKGEGARLLEMWRRPVELRHKGANWSVSMSHRDYGSTHDRFVLIVIKNEDPIVPLSENQDNGH
jgi:hypothetical protein